MKDSQNPKILIADDQTDVLEALKFLLKPEGYAVEAVTSPQAMLAALEEQDFDLVLMDLNYARDTTSGKEGLDLLDRIQSADSTLPVIVMTAWGSVDLAVEAIKRGARDFIQKPWDNARLLTILKTQRELGQALKKGQRLEAENRILRDQPRPRLIAESESMKPVLQIVNRVAASDANVLITGENGTGKGLLASVIHSMSLRAAKPLVTVNIGSIPEGVFESEMFGHVKGAFTDAKNDRVGRFELAENGTLFLDEIANLPLSQQPKLLRVLETGEFERVGTSKTRKTDARILSATNSDINQEVEEGRFRRDLLFRLNTVEIHLPPLRDRREDILILAIHFLHQHSRRYRKNIEGFDDSARQALLKYSFPGNVRELDHAIERAVLMAQSNLIQAVDLGLQRGREVARRLEDMSLEEVEAYLIQKTLAECDGNVSRAAEKLGLSRSALYRRLQRYGL
ncbi:MAG: sigma-54 dependent transcriptional regulator [Acidobacteriota bacterium]